MAKTKQQKGKTITDLAKNIKDAKSIVFVNFSKLKVKEVEQLRKNCRKENVGYMVAKKTLMKIAFKDAGVKDIDPKAFDKETAIVFGYGDEVAPARVIFDFAKEHDALAAFGGILDGQYVNREKVNELALLPGKEVLLAKMIGSIKAPVSGFVNVLSGNLRNLVYVLNAIKENKN
jgi:large subunit ribosomal protein L10